MGRILHGDVGGCSGGDLWGGVGIGAGARAGTDDSLLVGVVLRVFDGGWCGYFQCGVCCEAGVDVF